ncbi:hypothetical protein BH23ACT6_BH23ACT6_06210 [soil metagenome]
MAAVVAALVVAIPTLSNARPLGQPGFAGEQIARADLTPAQITGAIMDSASTPHTGVVNSSGTVQVPDADTFTSIATLFGEPHRIRVFWNDEEHWRLDRIRSTGETDLFRTPTSTTRWVYESRRVRVTLPAPVRLPDTSDVLPDTVARRALQGAQPDELSALPSARIAGRDAVGLRLSPETPQSSVDRVDIWADAESGIPLRVQVYAGAARPTLTTAYERLDLEAPPPAAMEFDPPPHAEVTFEELPDLASESNVFAPYLAPDTLAGLPLREDRPDLPAGAVGVYGRGPTVLLFLPLRGRAAEPLREELSKTGGYEPSATGTAVDLGPISVLVTPERFRGSGFLLVGTVTPEALEQAGRELADLQPIDRDNP